MASRRLARPRLERWAAAYEGLRWRPGISRWWLQWPFLLAAVPFLLVRDPHPLTNAVGLTFLALQQLARGLDPEERRRRFDLDVAWPVLGLVAMALLAFFRSPAPDILTLHALFGFLVSASAYTAVVSALRTRSLRAGRRRRLWVAIGIYAGVGVLVALIAYVMMDRRETDLRPLALLADARPSLSPELRRGLRNVVFDATHPNRVAGILTLFIPVYVALLVYRPWELLDRAGAGAAGPVPRRPALGTLFRVGTWLGLIVTALILIATISRTAFAAVIVGALVAVSMRWRPLRVAAAAGWAVLAVVLAVFFLDVPLFGRSGGMGSDLLGRLGWALQFGRAALEPWETFTWRLTLWPIVFSDMLAYPWTGQGPGTLKPYLGIRTHAHNIFLQTVVDLGIPGLLFFVALLALVVVRVVRSLRATRRGPHEGLAVAVGGALTAHLLWSMNDMLGLGLRLGAFFWILLALAVCLPTSRSADVDEAPEAAPPPRPASLPTADV